MKKRDRTHKEKRGKRQIEERRKKRKEERQRGRERERERERERASERERARERERKDKERKKERKKERNKETEKIGTYQSNDSCLNHIGGTEGAQQQEPLVSLMLLGQRGEGAAEEENTQRYLRERV